MDNLLMEGVSLMLLGMGAVFVFLTLLVFTTAFMSKLVAKFAPEVPKPVSATPISVAAANPATTDNTQLLAIISAAVHKHRSRHK